MKSTKALARHAAFRTKSAEIARTLYQNNYRGKLLILSYEEGSQKIGGGSPGTSKLSTKAEPLKLVDYCGQHANRNNINSLQT